MQTPSKLTTLIAAVALMANGAFIYSVVSSRAWAVMGAQAKPGKFRCAPINVLASAPTTVISGTSEHNAWSIQNLGPNAIYCNGINNGLSAVTSNNGVQVPANGGFLTSDMWGSSGQNNDGISCLAVTADQVAGLLNTRECEVY